MEYYLCFPLIMDDAELDFKLDFVLDVVLSSFDRSRIAEN